MRLYCNAYRLRAGAKLGALEEFVREDVRGRGGGGRRAAGRRNRFERKLVSFKREGRLRKRFACKSDNFMREGRGASFHYAPPIFTLARNLEDL